MRLAGNSEIGWTVTLSQRNVRELYHMMQLSNAQAEDGNLADRPMLFKALGLPEQLVVQVETDADHYGIEYPDAVAITHDEPWGVAAVELLTEDDSLRPSPFRKGIEDVKPPWDDDDHKEAH